MNSSPRRSRANTPARWQAALGRALAERVEVRQLAGSGAWVATSGSDRNAAYELAVTGNVAHGCGCLAGLNDDPVCKHRALFYHLAGALDLDSEPPATAAPAPAPCPECAGKGFVRMQTGGRMSDWWAIDCPSCRPKRRAA